MRKLKLKLKPTTEEFGALRLVLALAAFIAGASFCLAGSEWHQSPTFYYVNQLNVPWWLIGAFLIIAALCLIVSKIRPIGFLIGAIVYTFFSIASWLAVLGGLHLHILFLSYLAFPENTVASFFAAGNITTICVLYWSSLKYAIYVQVDPERVKMTK